MPVVSEWYGHCWSCGAIALLGKRLCERCEERALIHRTVSKRGGKRGRCTLIRTSFAYGGDVFPAKWRNSDS